MYFSKKFGKLRDQAVEHTDQRLKLINEVLSGFIALKMYCWEKPLSNLVFTSRKLEMKYIGRAATIKAINMAIYFASQPLVAIVVFLPYFYANRSLKASTIYPILAFFGIFKLSKIKLICYIFDLFLCQIKYYLFRLIVLFAVPEAVQLYSEIDVSVDRIKQFLLLPQISNNKIHASNTKINLKLIRSLDPSKFCKKYEENVRLLKVERVKTQSISENCGPSPIISTSSLAFSPTSNNSGSNNDARACYIEMNNASFSWDLVPTVTLKRVLTSKSKKKKVYWIKRMK